MCLNMDLTVSRFRGSGFGVNVGDVGALDDELHLELPRDVPE